MTKPHKSIDYKTAGVDTEKAQNLIQNLKKEIVSTHKNLNTGNVRKNFGGFAGLFQPHKKFNGFDLVAATDGVGTKIELCRQFNYFEELGYDLVGMCVNDLYCLGASPFFFLDYISCGKLDESWYSPLLKSITKACKSASLALLGGETAEHPGLMKKDEFDLAGFCVGAVDPKKALPKLDEIKEGDLIAGFASSGPHSNGFSLIRKILKKLKKENPAEYNSLMSDKNFIEKKLLIGTRIYSFIPEMISKVRVKAIAHITGGGFYENIPRILPETMAAYIEKPGIFNHDIFNLIERFVKPADMYKTFNMGIGIIAIIDKRDSELIKQFDKRSSIIGIIKKRRKDEKNVFIQGIDT